MARAKTAKQIAAKIRSLSKQITRLKKAKRKAAKTKTRRKARRKKKKRR